MALRFGFYNSANGDRRYNATHLGQMFDGVIQDGVFQTIGDHFQVTAVSGSVKAVNVGTGKAWLDRTWTTNDSIIVLSGSDYFPDVTTNSQSRIDAVVIDINKDTRINSIQVVNGTQATNPTKPTLANDSYHKQYALAYITIKGTDVAILQDNIENAVGNDSLPWVAGAMQAISTEQMVAQWEAGFNTWLNNEQANFYAWFDEMKGQLTEDAATNLQRELDELITYGTRALTEQDDLLTGKVYFQYED